MKSNKDKAVPEVAVFPATVVSILSPYRVVINRGAEHGLKAGQRFLIYELGEEEIIDPDTNENLGYLEIVKGTGRIIHLQEKLSTVESERTEPGQKTIVKRSSTFSIFGAPVEETTVPSHDLVPFDRPKIGDKVKPV